MSDFLSSPAIILLLSLGSILFVLCWIVTWTTRISIRLNKAEPPKLRFLFLIAFIQVMLGGFTALALGAITNNSLIDIGTGLGVAILSGLFFMKLIFRAGWGLPLRVWAVAVAMQLVLMPICSGIMIFGWVRFLATLFPPQL
jgi:hypothetical protein